MRRRHGRDDRRNSAGDLKAQGTTRPPPWDAIDCASPAAGDWEDVDDVRLSSWLARHHELHVGADVVRAAVDVVARQHVVNPVVDYLRGLRWDGQQRIDFWLSTYLGVEASDYARLVGRFFLISAVARAFRPGCKVDTMPILEGDQGANKSTAIGVLFGREWWSDTPPDLGSKDRFAALRDRWCIEWGELDGMGKADVDRLKGFLSSAIDDYRPSYGRRTVRVPRRSVFFGSVNREEYLRDETGNRRFWPVRTGTVKPLDVAGLALVRDQLWAEAVAAFEGGARWWPVPEEYSIFVPQQAERVVGDPWLDKIAEWVRARERVTVAEVLGTMLGIEPSRWTQVDQNRVARCLTLLGWKRVQYRTQGGLRERGYQAPTVPPRPGVTGVTGSAGETRDDFS
jgi:putative DNA primase/helicase